jgi:peptidoglycan/xylan/chitin deacetylase (PgdA/CDA1 family)
VFVATPTDRTRPRLGPLRNRSMRALFLCWHSIANEGPEFLSISPELFEAQLRLLRRRGFVSSTSLDLRELADRRRLDARRVFLTFDDGYLDNFTYALPLLRDSGFTAMFFVLPGHLDSGRALDWPAVEANRRRYPEIMRSLDWSMAEAMVEAGCEIGSHTLHHPHLPVIDDDALREELLDSRRRIIDRLGRCDSLAYPFGEWSPRVARAAAAAGYSFAFSLPFAQQLTASYMSIPRVTIDHRDDLRRFSLKISPMGRRLLFSPVRAGHRRVMGRKPA